MKNSIKLFVFALFLLLPFYFLLGCSDDPVSPNNPGQNDPPTFQDSVIKLYSPANDAHFYVGDTIRFTWSRSLAFRWGYYEKLDSNINIYASPTNILNDTVVNTWIVTDPTPLSVYWLILPMDFANQTYPQYRSEMRRFFIN